MPEPLPSLEVPALLAAIAEARGRRGEALIRAAEDVLAPPAYAQLLDGLGPAAGETRLEQWARHLAVTGGRVQPFTRLPLAEGAQLYRGTGAASDRTLLVAFTGLKGRFGIATPILLQALEARQHDLLLLSDSDRAGFRNGVPGLAEDFVGLVRAVDRLCPPASYRRRVAIGNSKGGQPALRYAVLAGCERAVALGARRGNDPLRLIRGQAVPTAFDPLCDCLSHRPLRALAVHAAQFRPDREFARELAARRGVRVMTVSHSDQHNLVATLREAGALKRFLTRVLSLDLSEATGTAPLRFSPEPPAPPAPRTGRARSAARAGWLRRLLSWLRGRGRRGA